MNGNLINKKSKGNWYTYNDAFFIGKNLNSSSSDHFKGKIDDVRIWSRALAYSDIELLLNIHEKPFEKFISVFPNPTTGKVFVNGSSFIIDRIEVYNILGEKVIEIFDVSSLDLFNETNGAYFLKIFDKDNRLIFTQKIIKY